MEKFEKTPFSATPNVLKKNTVAMLCMIMMGLFFVVGCKKETTPSGGTGGGGEEPNYPIDIPFTEYSLAETCQWTNLAYDNTVIIINSNEELKQYVACTGGDYPEIDFEKHSLLLVSGKTDSGIIKLTTKDLQQLSLDKYELNLEIDLFDNMNVSTWSTALVVEKVNKESCIDLNVTLLPLSQEPCSCIMDTLKGEWSWIKTYGGIGGNTTDNEFKSIIKILSQNEDASINYEVWVEDTLYHRGNFQYLKIIANIKLPHSCYCNENNWRISFNDMLNTWRFWDECVDGYYYMYQKIE